MCVIINCDLFGSNWRFNARVAYLLREHKSTREYEICDPSSSFLWACDCNSLLSISLWGSHLNSSQTIWSTWIQIEGKDNYPWNRRFWTSAYIQKWESLRSCTRAVEALAPYTIQACHIYLINHNYQFLMPCLDFYCFILQLNSYHLKWPFYTNITFKM